MVPCILYARHGHLYRFQESGRSASLPTRVGTCYRGPIACAQILDTGWRATDAGPYAGGTTPRYLQQYLSIPVYTIFKNLTIILIAYGEVLWFGGHVTGMTLVSFGLMVLSSLIAAWDDISKALLQSASEQVLPTLVDANAKASGNTAAGYLWMMVNCMVSAGYVLGMRKRIKVTNFKVSWTEHSSAPDRANDPRPGRSGVVLRPGVVDSVCVCCRTGTRCTTTTFSQSRSSWYSLCCSSAGLPRHSLSICAFSSRRRLHRTAIQVVAPLADKAPTAPCLQPRRDAARFDFHDGLLRSGGGVHLLHDCVVCTHNKLDDVQVRSHLPIIEAQVCLHLRAQNAVCS